MKDFSITIQIRGKFSFDTNQILIKKRPSRILLFGVEACTQSLKHQDDWWCMYVSDQGL